MKKFNLFILFIISLFSFNVFGETYTVVTDPTYPPFQFTDGQGKIIGLEIDIINAIAKNQGFSVEYSHHVWDGIFNQLIVNKADILASGIVANEIESNEIVVTKSYLRSLNCLAYLDKNNLQNWQEKLIAVVEEGELETTLASNFGASNIRPLKKDFLALKEVIIGQANLAAGDCNVMEYYAHSPTIKGRGYQFYFNPLKEESEEAVDLVFALRKSDTELLKKINNGIKNIKDSGELNKILKKWRIDI